MRASHHQSWERECESPGAEQRQRARVRSDAPAAPPQKKPEGGEDEPAPDVEEVKKKVKTKGGKKAAADEAEAGAEEEVPWLERP